MRGAEGRREQHPRKRPRLDTCEDRNGFLNAGSCRSLGSPRDDNIPGVLALSGNRADNSITGNTSVTVIGGPVSAN